MTSTSKDRSTLASKVGKSLVKGFLGAHRTLYRLTKGKVGASMGGMQVLLLTTTGRKTGKVRTWPLAYFRDGDTYVIVGSNGGDPHDPAWCHNLRSNGRTTVQVGAETLQVRAEEATAEEHPRLWEMVVTKAPNFDEYQKKTSREIPLFILHPIT